MTNSDMTILFFFRLEGVRMVLLFYFAVRSLPCILNLPIVAACVYSMFTESLRGVLRESQMGTRRQRSPNQNSPNYLHQSEFN